MAEGLLTMSVAELERSHVVRQAVEDRPVEDEKTIDVRMDAIVVAAHAASVRPQPRA